MARRESGITNSTDNRESCFDSFFYQLAQRIFQVRLFEVATGGDVNDANVILVLVREHPAQALFDVALGNASGLSDLYEDDLRLGRNAPVKAVRQVAITCRNHRGHHSVPTRDVGLFQR